MSLRPQKAVASFDSATALLSALARALRGQEFRYLGQSRLKAPLVRASAALPTGLRRHAYAMATGAEALRADRLADVDLERVADWATGRYDGGRYPAVLLGSSNGALTHLAAACRIPWLPQTFLVPVRRLGADPSDAGAALAFGVQHGRRLLDHNLGVELHHMHDPNQDALSASQMAYFRVKWQVLPRAYERFLRERLEPGAPIVVVRDTSSWPVTRVGDRHVFQLGALGGMSPQEYLAGPGAPDPDETTAEAEWGFAEPLLAPVREWAERHGHPVVELSYDHPQRPSAAVADVFREWLQHSGDGARRLLVSSFIVHDPWRTIATASVPFWTYFPTLEAADNLDEYLDRIPYEHVDILLFNHGVPSRGLAGADVWERLAGRAAVSGRLLGVDGEQFPADFTAFARYSSALRKLPGAHPPSSSLRISTALAGLDAAPGVSVTTV